MTIEIVGVVEDSLYEGPREGVRRQVFVPNWGRNSATFYVRTTAASPSAYSLARNEVKALNPSMPVYALKTLEAQLDETLLTDRLSRSCPRASGSSRRFWPPSGSTASWRLSSPVEGRSSAYAWRSVRSPGLVVWLVMREVLAAARDRARRRHSRRRWHWAGWCRPQLYGVQPGDPWMALSTVALLAIVSAAAGLIPAHRASRIDPILALRYE